MSVPVKDKPRNSVVFLVYLGVSFIYFGKTILSGKLLGWADALFEDYPIRVYYSLKLLANNEFHLWLPYEYLGLPLLGILHPGLLYPLNFLYFVLPAPFAFNLNFILHYVLAAFFTYLYVRLLGIRPFPAFIAGLVFGYSGYLLGYVKAFTSLRNAAAWLPLILYLYEMLGRTLSLRYAALAAIIVAIQVFAGHYQVCVYTYLILGLFVSYYFFRIEREKRIRFFFLSLVPIVFGSLIALPQLLSTKELSNFAWRPSLGYDFFTGGSFSPILLLVWFLPFTSELWPSYWPIAEITLSPIVPFTQILAIWTVIKLRKEEGTHTFFWGLIAIIAFFLALGKYNPLYHLMYYIPVYNLFRVPARHLLAYNFAIAVLSAIALNRLLYTCDVKSLKSLTVASVTVTACSALFVILIKILIADPLSTTILTKQTINTIASVVSLSNYNLVITFLSYLLFIVWLFVMYKTSSCSPHRTLARRITLIISYCLIPILVICNGYYLDRLRPNNPKILDVNHLFQNNPIFEYIKANTFWDRSVFVVRHSNLYNIPAEVHTLNGYDPLITSAFAELLYMGHWSTSSNWAGLLQNNLILSTLNARYVIVPQQDVQKYRLEEIKTAVGVPSFLNIPLGQWELINSKKTGSDGSEYILASPDGKQVSMIKQRISLKPNAYYLMKLEAKRMRNEPQRELSFDLCGGPGYDSPDQELDVNGRALQKDYRVFGRIINTGNIPPQVDLRVFTFSTEPIVVKNIEIQELSNFGPPYIAGDVSNISTEESLYKKVFETPEWVVYENRNCLPRAFTVSKLRPVRDMQEVKFLFETFQINPSETALVSEDDLKKIGRSDFVKGTTIIEQYDTDCIVVRTNVFGGPGFLVLSDQYFPGWKAFVDGKETPIYKVHEIIRGIVIPEGEHKVEFVYRPSKIYISIFIGAVALVACLVAVFRRG